MSKHACAPLVRASFAAVLSGFALLGWSSAALSAEAELETEDEELTEVQVTGTRIQSPNVTSANPITSVTGEEMRQLGIVNVSDALTTLVPQNISTYMPTMIGDDQSGSGGAGMESLDRGSFFIGQTIANLRGMDPTFGTRTLTLVDGRRMPSTSNQADVVDMNIIPSNLLQRMDVVTGGASATYGSGAMAGVVNLVLANRLTGVNLDMDYGVNEAGDGGSPHVSLSGGLPLFSGRGHVLMGLEWQKQDAIRDCAAARDWCAESRALISNFTGSGANPAGVATLLPEYSNGQYPARFEASNLRYSQFAPTGTIYVNNSNINTNLRFNAEGTDLEEYALGYRGGTGSNAMNGDGPLVTSGTAMRPSSERRTMFTNFEFDFTPNTTGYFQGNYAKTSGENRNRYTTGNYCVRFNTQGVIVSPGATVRAGESVGYGGNTAVSFDFNTGAQIVHPTRHPAWTNANFRAFLGYELWDPAQQRYVPQSLSAPSTTTPYWVQNVTTGANQGFPAATLASQTNPPTGIRFVNATPVWTHMRNNHPVTGTEYWLLTAVIPNQDFNDPGTPAVLPQMGRNAYAFLNQLTPDALAQMQRSFGVASGSSSVFGAIIDPTTGLPQVGTTLTAGGAAATGLDTLYGSSACSGFTAMRKVWNPQVQQWSTNTSETMRGLAGIKGRFGSDWRWDAYYQYGKTDSASKQNNVATNLRLAMAVDAVIDDRVGSATFGQPGCRVVRDGIPIIDYQGRPISAPDDLQELANDCKPINLFGTSFATPEAAALQQQAIDYAFVESVSTGSNSLQTLSLSTSGTLWQGWAGPLSGAFGLEVRQDKVDNASTDGSASFYERADLARTWADGFSGKTRVTEGYTELDMPMIVGMDGINLLAMNVGARYASYYNKGGAGTTGQDATQNVMNWKFQTTFEPFDWIRMRVTRSRDLRAAGYRDLFINQPRLPDQFSGNNPWRERTAFSAENQFERWGQTLVGNPDLKPEKSNTLTLGLVLQPGGWAQGMRFTADYYTINIKDAIVTPFTSESPITACWEDSGNVRDTYLDGDVDPDSPGVNGLFDPSLGSCQEIVFGRNDDGSINLQDIVSYNSARPRNSLPYQSRGVDVSLDYRFPLNRAFESLPGSVSITVRGTRALESSGIQVASGASAGSEFDCQQRGGTYEDSNCYIPRELTGQIRSSTFIPGVAASPKWAGNIITSYLLGDLSMSLSTRYIGGAKIDKEWCDEVGCANYQNSQGQFLLGSIDNNTVKPYFNFSLNGSYNLQVADMKQFQVFGSINNLFDKSPPFTGGGLSGATAQYHDTMGRAYRMGVRLKF